MEYKDQVLLKKFMKEHFHFPSLRKVGIFTKEMRFDYTAQAKRICELFGYESVYEYGSKEIKCHISYSQHERPTWINKDGQLKTEPFVTVIKSIYEE